MLRASKITLEKKPVYQKIPLLLFAKSFNLLEIKSTVEINLFLSFFEQENVSNIRT